MAFDPNQPAPNSPLDSGVMRAQLNGLNDKIPTGAEIGSVLTLGSDESATVALSLLGTVFRFDFGIPRGFPGVAGEPGPQGVPGPAFATVVVDAVVTLNPGESAYVTATLVGDVVHLVIGIPRGADGGAGPQGVPGQPFANVIIDSVTTLNAGESAYVTASFDGTNVHLNIGIPRGANGNDGAPGAQGIQGPPGEVTAAQLTTAIAGTANNTNAVPTLDTPFTNDPPTLADLETLRLAYNALVLAQRR